MSPLHKKKVTIRDIAERCGVSTATVSYVINGKSSRYSAETLDKIHAVMKDAGYEPDFTARSLACGKTRLLGLILPLQEKADRSSTLLRDNPFYSELADAIMEVAAVKGYDLIISGLRTAEESLPWIRRRKPDGLIYLGFFPEDEKEILSSSRIPVVLIDSETGVGAGYWHIRTDERQAACDAVTALIQDGHSRIAFVSGPIGHSRINALRRAGWADALTTAGYEPVDSSIYEFPVSFDGGRQAAHSLLENGLKETAVFCVADIMAFGLMRALSECGVAVPERISVMGFDDIDLCRYFLPGLTTVRQDIGSKGREAARILIDSIEGLGITPDTIYIRHSILRRGTTGPVPAL